MIRYDLANSDQDLRQILELQRDNLPENISASTRKNQGFVTVKHTLELLRMMNDSGRQVIAKDNDRLAGYALMMKKELRNTIPVLRPMFELFSTLSYEDRSLESWTYYVMGQVCVAKDFRGQGVFDGLYQKHKEVYSPYFDLCVTEISTSNGRSMRAHERIGFETIHKFQDTTDEWNIVVWKF